MVSLRSGTFSHVATRRNATRALASYHRLDGSLALPCLAAFLLNAPARVARPWLIWCRPHKRKQIHPELQGYKSPHCNLSEHTLCELLCRQAKECMQI